MHDPLWRYSKRELKQFLSLIEHHAINAHGAKEVQIHSLQASTHMKVNGQLPASAALQPAEWIGLKSGLDVLTIRKISCSSRESNPDFIAVHLAPESVYQIFKSQECIS